MERKLGTIKTLLGLSLGAFLLSGPVGGYRNFYSAAQDLTELGEEQLDPGTTEINVKDAEISTIVKIFSRKTLRNYVLDERVRGKVSIYLPGRVSAEESVRILDSVLALKGFSAVPIGDNIWKIIPAKEAKQTTIPTVGDPDGIPSASVVTRLVQLKYISADEVKQLISPLVSSDGLVNAYTGTNSLILIDFEDNAQRLVEIINSLDIPYTDWDMTILRIEHADAVDVAEKIKTILGESSPAGGGAADSGMAAELARIRMMERAAARGGPGAITPEGFSAAATVGARTREPKIIADERTNSIILVADEDSTARIEALVSQLDSPVNLSGRRFYVYRCQHANANELAEVLSGLVSGGTSGGTGAAALGRGRDSAVRTQRAEDRLSATRRTPGRPRTEGAGAVGATSVSFGEELSITADPSTNSLIISGSRDDYEKIKELLLALDVKRRQVLVEAVILEVGIDDDVEAGMEWLASGGGADGGVIGINNMGNLTTLLSNPAQLSSFTLAAASSGSLTLPGGLVIPSQALLVKAAREASNVNVLSAPTLLTTDNEEAEIVVGQNVPFLASTSTSQDNLNNVFNQIDRQDVGITLRLTPQISSSNYVKLRLFTEVSSLVPVTLASSLGPTTTIRTSDTTVIAKDSQMVVIGGLISDDITQSRRGVPYLMDVPVLGHLFSVTRDRQRQTNLLVFITPRILKDQYDARDQTLAKSGVLADVIDHYQVVPSRQEVLTNPDMNRVTEAHLYEGQKPTTILAPTNRAAIDLTALKPGYQEPLALRASPRLPDAKGQAAPVAQAPSAAARSTQPELHGRFVILQSENPAATGAPFLDQKNGPLVGLVVPEGSSSAARNFFSAGQRYVYQAGSEALPLRALGVFSSAAEALSFYESSDQSWYVLSPHEIMTLGRGPWKKR